MVDRAVAMRLFSQLFGFMSVLGVLLYGSRVAYLFTDPTWFWPLFGAFVVLIALALYGWRRGPAVSIARAEESPMYMIGTVYGVTMYVSQLVGLQREALQAASAEPSAFLSMVIMSFGKIIWFSFWISAFGAGVAFALQLLVNRFKNK
ncbi:MAG: hypothetical protein QG604_160 [Candidatus Dependentiae bacterium]|nr:hypothetical protein [Candidatus Dependentiae bacterium]